MSPSPFLSEKLNVPLSFLERVAGPGVQAAQLFEVRRGDAALFAEGQELLERLPRGGVDAEFEVAQGPAADARQAAERGIQAAYEPPPDSQQPKSQ